MLKNIVLKQATKQQSNQAEHASKIKLNNNNNKYIKDKQNKIYS